MARTSLPPSYYHIIPGKVTRFPLSLETNVVIEDFAFQKDKQRSRKLLNRIKGPSYPGPFTRTYSIIIYKERNWYFSVWELISPFMQGKKLQNSNFFPLSYRMQIIFHLGKPIHKTLQIAAVTRRKSGTKNLKHVKKREEKLIRFITESPSLISLWNTILLSVSIGYGKLRAQLTTSREKSNWCN